MPSGTDIVDCAGAYTCSGWWCESVPYCRLSPGSNIQEDDGRTNQELALRHLGRIWVERDVLQRRGRVSAVRVLRSGRRRSVVRLCGEGLRVLHLVVEVVHFRLGRERAVEWVRGGRVAELGERPSCVQRLLLERVGK